MVAVPGAAKVTTNAVEASTISVLKRVASCAQKLTTTTSTEVLAVGLIACALLLFYG